VVKYIGQNYLVEDTKTRVGYITLPGFVRFGREHSRDKSGPQALLEQLFTGSGHRAATELNELATENYLGHQLI